MLDALLTSYVDVQTNGFVWDLRYRGNISEALDNVTLPINCPVVDNTQKWNAAGARVERGATLLVMEAMKMEHTIVAPADGVVADVLFSVGDQVDEGAELVRFEAP